MINLTVDLYQVKRNFGLLIVASILIVTSPSTGAQEPGRITGYGLSDTGNIRVFCGPTAPWDPDRYWGSPMGVILGSGQLQGCAHVLGRNSVVPVIMSSTCLPVEDRILGTFTLSKIVNGEIVERIPGIYDVRTPELKAVAPRFTRSVFTNGFVTYGDPEFPNGWVRVYAIFENVLPANAVFEYFDGSTWRSTTGSIGLRNAILKVPNTNVTNPLLRVRANGVTNNFGYARPTTSKTFTEPAQRPYVRPSSNPEFPTYRFRIQNKTATMGVRG